jgi:hypothetical protein
VSPVICVAAPFQGRVFLLSFVLSYFFHCCDSVVCGPDWYGPDLDGYQHCLCGYDIDCYVGNAWCLCGRGQYSHAVCTPGRCVTMTSMVGCQCGWSIRGVDSDSDSSWHHH